MNGSIASNLCNGIIYKMEQASKAQKRESLLTICVSSSDVLAQLGLAFDHFGIQNLETGSKLSMMAGFGLALA